jgi:hypothetical protein
MDFNKIEKTIIDKNFTIKYILAHTTKMSPNGFRLALKNKTLKVDHLEKITEAIGIPMKYWWEKDDDLLKYSGDNNDAALLQENKKLLKRIERQEETIDNLNDHIRELRLKLGLGKVGT